LRDLIAEAIDALLAKHPGGRLEGRDYADALMGLFCRVDSEWKSIDITMLADRPGSRMLDQRLLVAWIPRGVRERRIQCTYGETSTANDCR